MGGENYGNMTTNNSGKVQYKLPLPVAFMGKYRTVFPTGTSPFLIINATPTTYSHSIPATHNNHYRNQSVNTTRNRDMHTSTGLIIGSKISFK